MKKRSNAITLKILSTALLVSCSGFHSPESIESKMARFESGGIDQNIVPDLVIDKSHFRGSRFPASAGSMTSKTPYGKLSNKKLYFLQLLDQYYKLGQYTSKSEINKVVSCPQFHTQMVNYHEANHTAHKKSIRVEYQKEKLTNAAYLASHPELSLPTKHDGKFPTLAQVIGDKNHHEQLIDVITLHAKKTKQELVELCESGTSNNYYIFENMLTHIKRKGNAQSTKNAQTLLKTTVYANKAILASISKYTKTASRSIASVGGSTNQIEIEVQNRMNSKWFDQYIDSTLRK
jgi:hypothetical protein